MRVILSQLLTIIGFCFVVTIEGMRKEPVEGAEPDGDSREDNAY
jgi:hypothetical protein